MKKSILLTAMLVMISLLFGTAWAKQPPPPPPTPACGGLTGTWHGREESGDMRWLAIHTSDSLDPTKGEMLMNWIYVNPRLIYPGDTLTPGHGVWQLNSDSNYNYTWYAYVINPDGDIIGTVRVSGVAMFQNPYDPDATAECSTVAIYYQFEVAAGEVPMEDLGTAAFEPGPKGGAIETRVPMVVTPLPPQP